MNVIVLDGAALETKEQVHTLLAEALQFPQWYGGNLDALYDCLTDCFPEEQTLLLLTHPNALTTHLGPWADALRTVLRDACAERESLIFAVEEV